MKPFLHFLFSTDIGSALSRIRRELAANGINFYFSRKEKEGKRKEVINLSELCDGPLRSLRETSKQVFFLTVFAIDLRGLCVKDGN